MVVGAAVVVGATVVVVAMVVVVVVVVGVVEVVVVADAPKATVRTSYFEFVVLATYVATAAVPSDEFAIAVDCAVPLVVADNFAGVAHVATPEDIEAVERACPDS